MSPERKGPPPPPDPDHGRWQGRSIARRFESPDGMIVLVGKSAADNDILSLHLGAPNDFWFHVAAESGSHVVVRNPDNLARLPRETARFAAALAAGYSKARNGGRVAVHMSRCANISKPRGLPAGKVMLRGYETIEVTPLHGDDIRRNQDGASSPSQ